MTNFTITSTFMYCFTIITFLIIFMIYKLLNEHHPKRKFRVYKNNNSPKASVINTRQEINQCIIYLRSRISNPTPLYTPKGTIYQRFQKNPTDELTLTALAYDILKHCHYTPAALTVKVLDYNDQESIAGMYKIQGHASVIEIKDFPDIREEEILAILIHECMHFYLRCRKIEMPDKHQNEVLTDVTAIYMGFYKCIKAGYGRVGYLKIQDVDYVDKTFHQIKVNL